jgi:site-specific recombinase XerD
MQRNTGNLKAVQRLLGHENIATTARYAHVFVDDLREAMEAKDKARSRHRVARRRRKA